jgi:small subunit ribosomal protein S21
MSEIIIVERKDNENVNHMLRRYKRKHKKIRLYRQVRENRYYTKKSVERRNEILNAKYRQEEYGK